MGPLSETPVLGTPGTRKNLGSANKRIERNKVGVTFGMEPIEVWRWQYTETEGPNCGKRAVSSWHMSAEDAKRYKDAVPVPWTREICKSVGSMSDFSPGEARQGRTIL
jgi:hypothetical protein